MYAEPKDEIEIERSKNLAILEEVLGKKIHHTEPIDPVIQFRKSKLTTDKLKSYTIFSTTSTNILTPRFDPTKIESKELEITHDPQTLKNRKANIDFDELDRNEEKEFRKKRAKTEQLNKNIFQDKNKTEFTENYYEVNSNLKEIFTSTEDFCLGSFLGLGGHNLPDSVNEANNKATFEPIIDGAKKKLIKLMRNPFKYDSSDEEDQTRWEGDNNEDYIVDETAIEQQNQEKEDKVNIKITVPQPLTFSGFFFKPNDPRLFENPFYSVELVKKVCENGQKRSEEMMKALSLRKRAALKNVKSDKKYVEKLKLKRNLMKDNKRKRRKNLVKSS